MIKRSEKKAGVKKGNLRVLIPYFLVVLLALGLVLFCLLYTSFDGASGDLGKEPGPIVVGPIHRKPGDNVSLAVQHALKTQVIVVRIHVIHGFPHRTRQVDVGRENIVTIWIVTDGRQLLGSSDLNRRIPAPVSYTHLITWAEDTAMSMFTIEEQNQLIDLSRTFTENLTKLVKQETEEIKE